MRLPLLLLFRIAATQAIMMLAVMVAVFNTVHVPNVLLSDHHTLTRLSKVSADEGGSDPFNGALFTRLLRR